MDRRSTLKTLMSAATLLSMGFTDISSLVEKIRKNTIPASGAKLPCVGLGTWQTFDVGPSTDARQPLIEVLKALLDYGGSVIDSSPMYGRSEDVVGDLAAVLGVSESLFMATKVWTVGKHKGIFQMNKSMHLMKTSQIDLMQIHNLLDWQTHIKTLRDCRPLR